MCDCNDVCWDLWSFEGSNQDDEDWCGPTNWFLSGCFEMGCHDWHPAGTGPSFSCWQFGYDQGGCACSGDDGNNPALAADSGAVMILNLSYYQN